MTQPRENPKPVLDFGSEIVVRFDDGAEWCLYADDPELDACRKDWDHFDPAECQPADWRALLGELEKSA